MYGDIHQMVAGDVIAMETVIQCKGEIAEITGSQSSKITVIAGRVKKIGKVFY